MGQAWDREESSGFVKVLLSPFPPMQNRALFLPEEDGGFVKQSPATESRK